ncbi:MAG: UDP-3-O-(3-hydroxymyristoyl)glucosamine N-acyltransferase [Planctomycetota bacterium]|nr:UDP-3-O-(3-hydroxymyristoyl)glucosamine N-acyltransferase [Planctomycetota bacterium]
MNTITLAELAASIGAEVVGDSSRSVSGPASLAEAGPDEVSFLAQPRYRSQLDSTRAAAVVVAADLEVEGLREDLVLLRCEDPNAAFTRVIRAFVPAEAEPAVGVHPSAVIEAGAEVDPTASVGPLCHVAAGAKVGPRTRLVSRVSLGPHAEVGADSVLFAGVVLYERVVLGARCIVHAGSVLGSDGYGFEPSPEGWVKVPQCGTVIVEDDVEVGANVTVDRARFGATRICRGVKIDNLVHIAHNVVVGENALLVAQVGVSGSTRVGPWAILGGKVGVAGHLDIGQGARVGGGSDVFTDVPAGTDFLGSPARERMQTLRAQASARKVPKVIEDLRGLRAQNEALIARLETLEAAAGLTNQPSGDPGHGGPA